MLSSFGGGYVLIVEGVDISSREEVKVESEG